MKTINSVFLILILVLNYSCVEAQSEEPNEIINTFFFEFEKSGSDVALDYIFSTNYWMEEYSKDAISNIKVDLKSFINLVGDYYSFEFITEKSIGHSFRLYSYLVKYDRQPIRFVFIFYKPNDKWMIYNFKYDIEIAEELEDAARAYRLKENLDF